MSDLIVPGKCELVFESNPVFHTGRVPFDRGKPLIVFQMANDSVFALFGIQIMGGIVYLKSFDDSCRSSRVETIGYIEFTIFDRVELSNEFLLYRLSIHY